jgi:flagellar motor switch protein FliG
MPEPTKLNGVERSAILILALGERKAADVLRQMEPKEVQRIGAAMTRLGAINRDQINAVLAAFGMAVQSDSMLTVGVEDYLRNVMVSALGEQKARGILERVLDRDDDTLGNLKWMDPKAIAAVLKDEHPQVTALALASMEPDQAALVLPLLPADQRTDVVTRIATLDELQPGALSEVRAIL